MENKKLVFFFYIHWVLYGPHTPWAVTHISSLLYSFMVPTFGKRLPQQWSCRNVRRWLTAQAGLSHCWFKEIYCWSVVNTHTHTHTDSPTTTQSRGRRRPGHWPLLLLILVCTGDGQALVVAVTKTHHMTTGQEAWRRHGRAHTHTHSVMLFLGSCRNSWIQHICRDQTLFVILQKL